MNFDIGEIFLNKIYKSNKFSEWYKLRNEPASNRLESVTLIL